jgi:hypothetical protein
MTAKIVLENDASQPVLTTGRREPAALPPQPNAS